jgi:histidinol phosphatase-like enzyme (inositol monophosphatase family)
MSKTNLPDALHLAHSLADAARPIARRWFRSSVSVEFKNDDSPVTRADREIEAELRRKITEAFPQHGILGEEEAPVAPQSEYVWVIDPIDGTKSFISGMPTFGTLIALLRHGVPQLGIIDMPILEERWVGQVGGATSLNGVPARTRSGTSLADAVVYTTSPDDFSLADLARFERVSRAARMRRFGGDCYAYALLASGTIDVVVEAGLQPYDYLALVTVVEGAGGKITDWTGLALTPDSDGRVVATASSALHEKVLEGLAVGRRTRRGTT